VVTPERWRRYLEREGVPVDDRYPSATLSADGLNGAKLYRQNIPRRIVRPPPLASAHAPVQLIVPSRDRFISESYYDAAERVAPQLVRRTIAASHWAIRTHAEQVAAWIAGFARDAGHAR
jgi:pimeloyl-ACP methyl ester carboxylesterase